MFNFVSDEPFRKPITRTKLEEFGKAGRLIIVGGNGAGSSELTEYLKIGVRRETSSF